MMRGRAMSKLPRSAAALVAAVAFPAGVLAQDEVADEIELKNAQPVTGVTVTSDTWMGVVAKKGEVEVKYSVNDVEEIVYDGMPAQLSRGKRAVAYGYYTTAIEKYFEPLLGKVNSFRKVGGRPWIEQYVLYYLGLCHLKRTDRKPDDAAKAREYFQKLAREIPDSRFIFDARMGIAESWQIEGRNEQAASEYEEAMKAFEKMAEGRSPDLRQFVLRQARLAEHRAIGMLGPMGKFDEQAKRYRELETKASRYKDQTDIVWLARVGVAQALVAAGSYRNAVTECKNMIEAAERSGETQYLGGAYLSLADCFYKQAEEKEKAGNEKEAWEDYVVARWNYLRTSTVFFTASDLMPRAYFGAGMCYSKLAKSPREGGEQRAMERARRQFEALVRSFPQSGLAEKARGMLERMQGASKAGGA
jgi:tetratricopeptide (TPR) repeat protein